jgi:lysophospholipase L1-like esterase
MKIARPLTLITSFTICLLAAEVALRLFAPVPDPYAELKYRRAVNQYIKSEFPSHLRLLTTAEEGLPGVQGSNQFTTNNRGFRGDEMTVPKPVDEFRIFMVGGSTTECLYLDDSKAVTRVLQEELGKHAPAGMQVRVYGAGKSGDASDDHISIIAHRIAHLEPDMIILFSGINDLTRSINDYDYLHYPRELPAQKAPLLPALATESQLARRVYYLFSNLPADVFPSTALPLHSQYKESVRQCQSMPATERRPKLDPTPYANNLRTIAGVAKTHGIRLIFMTQQTTWGSTDDPTAKDWQWVICRSGERYREDFMAEGLEVLNNEMRGVAKENSLPLYDLAKTMPKTLEFFYDDVHFNNRGAFVAGTELAALILEGQMLSPRAVRSAAADHLGW